MKDLNNDVEAETVSDQPNESVKITEDPVKSETDASIETILPLAPKAKKVSVKKEVKAKAKIEVKKSPKKEKPEGEIIILPKLEEVSKTEPIVDLEKTEPGKKKDKKIEVIKKKAKKAEEKVDKLKKKVKKAKKKEVKKSILKGLKEKLETALEKFKSKEKKLKKAKK